jgi:hypothetical protein
MPIRPIEGRQLSPIVSKGKKRVDVYLPENQERQFKEEVFKRKGMKKGNISEAVQEAILLWINTGESKASKKQRD